MNRFARVVLIAAGVVVFLAACIRLTLGGGERLEDRSGAPSLSSSALELVAELEYPPGNIAVSSEGRVFVTLHPDGKPPMKVAELVEGNPVPWPSAAWQHERRGSPYFQSILSLRIDRQRRLWVLDFADYGRGQPRLVAFDIDSGELVHQYDFPAEVAGLGSMLNDLQVDPAGETIYIAETSPIVQRPALIVYDVTEGTSRRVLDGHVSVKAKNFLINAVGRDMRIYGLLALRIGVDSIALDRRGEYLYYGPVNGDRLYRIATRDLDDTALSSEELADRVEDFAAKTLSDGLTTDDADNVYITDMEHSAILRLSSDGRLETLLKDPRLRWPDGFSFGPDGWLYVTCSSLHHVLFVGSAHMKANAPYHVYRFSPGATAVAGH